MPLPEERTGLLRQINELNSEIRQLKTSLNKINDQKEAFFRKKEELNKQISELIGEVKLSRSERNQFTTSVKESKVIRRELNSKIIGKIEAIKKLNKEKNEIARKHNIEGDPSHIKAEIEKLNSKIETEVMSFNKEKGVMKEINALKKKYDKAKKVSDVWDKVHELSTEIENLKEKADAKHKSVQSSAKTSQEKHEIMMNASHDIDDIKKKEEGYYAKFIEKKKEFTEVNTKLKEKLEEIANLNLKLGERKKEKKKEKESKNRTKLDDLKKQVEEKLKKGGKLTTEDLIILQGE
jgi:phosphoserine phosphatase